MSRAPAEPPPRPTIPEEFADIPGAVRERVRLAIIELIRRKESVAVRPVRALAAVDQGPAARLVRAHKAGQLPPIFHPWDETADPKREEKAERQSAMGRLEEMVRKAATDADREAIAHELAALVAAGTLDPSAAREIRGALAEARHAAGAAREADPGSTEDPTKMLMASAEAMEAARAIDFLTDPARRQRVLDYVAAELAADLAAHPNTDQGGAAAPTK